MKWRGVVLEGALYGIERLTPIPKKSKTNSLLLSRMKEELLRRRHHLSSGSSRGSEVSRVMSFK